MMSGWRSRLGELLAAAGFARHLVEEARREHDVEHGVADRHGQRIAAEVVPCVPATMPLAALAVARHPPSGKPPPMPLGESQDIGRHAGRSVGEELAGAADAGLHLVEHQQHAAFVAELAQRAQEGRIGDLDAALSWIGSTRIAAVSGVMAAFTASMSPNGTWSKLRLSVRSPRNIFGLPPAATMAIVRPWKALEGNDVEALGMAFRRMILCAPFTANSSASAGIGRRRPCRRSWRRRAGAPDARLPESGTGWRYARGLACSVMPDEMRMAIAERDDRDAAAEVEISLSLGRHEPFRPPARSARVGRYKGDVTVYSSSGRGLRPHDAAGAKPSRNWWSHRRARPAKVRSWDSANCRPKGGSKTMILFGVFPSNA